MKKGEQIEDKDKWIDFLASKNYPVEYIYKNLITRINQDEEGLKKNMNQRDSIIKSTKQRVEEEISRMPLHRSTTEVLGRLKQKFKIENSILRSLIRSYFWPFRPEKYVFEHLERFGYKIRSKVFKGVCHYVLAMSSEMQNNYRQFGQYVNIDFSFVPLKRGANLRSHDMGIFSGQDNKGRKIIFGICIVNGTQFIKYKQVLQAFFDNIPFPPHTIITSMNLIILKSLNSIKTQQNFKFTIRVNWYYILEKLKKELYLSEEKRDVRGLFVCVLNALNKKQFERAMQNLENGVTIKGNMHKLRRILEGKRHFCLSEEAGFVGFGIEDRVVKELLSRIKSHYRYCEKIGVFLLESIRLVRTLEKGSQPTDLSHQLLSVYADPKNPTLSELANKLSFPILKKFLYQYQQTQQNCHLIQNSPLQVCVFESSTEQFHYLRYSVIYSCWYCDCKYLAWSGLPCCHLIKVIEHFGGVMMYYVNSRWVL